MKPIAVINLQHQPLDPKFRYHDDAGLMRILEAPRGSIGGCILFHALGAPLDKKPTFRRWLDLLANDPQHGFEVLWMLQDWARDFERLHGFKPDGYVGQFQVDSNAWKTAVRLGSFQGEVQKAARPYKGVFRRLMVDGLGANEPPSGGGFVQHGWAAVPVLELDGHVIVAEGAPDVGTPLQRLGYPGLTNVEVAKNLPDSFWDLQGTQQTINLSNDAYRPEDLVRFVRRGYAVAAPYGAGAGCIAWDGTPMEWWPDVVAQAAQSAA